MEQIENCFPFETFRPGQREAIEQIAKCLDNNKHFVFEAPTGTGKSVIAFTVGEMLLSRPPKVQGPPILILTSTRQLQKQYMDTFKKFGAEHIWSAKNYKCLVHTKSTEPVYYGFPGLCPGRKCGRYSECPYMVQKKKFLSANVGICNYHYFIHSTTLRPKIIICDEAHNLQKILCDNDAITLSKIQFERMCATISKNSTQLKMDVIEITDNIKKLISKTIQSIEEYDMAEYCGSMIDNITSWTYILYKEIEDIASSGNGDERTDMTISKLGNVCDRLDRLNCKLQNFLESESRWVVSEKDEKKQVLVFKPLEVVESSKRMEKRCNSMLFMSATICGADQYMKELGFESDYETLELTSPFPLNNRRVHIMPAGSLNYKNREELLPAFVKKIDYIIDKLDQYDKYSGIIHSVSYANAEYIDRHSKHNHRMLIPTQEEKMNLETVIQERKGCILVSPSMLEGVDLIDDLSRFQIFFKVPYSSLGDRWIKMKQANDPKWYARDVIVKIIQGAGRSIRTEKDWAWTFILDGAFLNLINRNGELFPKWFKDSITTYR